ncbi:MAG: pantoate--beta-alanine ligase [Chitinophagaceae bacterium]|nr:pantoate--beta-alanine ligase [Chitinophagaceae bacterium]
MILFKNSEDLIAYIKRKGFGKPDIGFIPTMGALHQGHLSLIEASRKERAFTLCSIFINPTQFNDPGDYHNYPVTLENDIELLEQAETDALFLPSAATIYPDGTRQLRHYELAGLEDVLEGKFRPGHFQGVCQVMHRLLTIVGAAHLYMGQKDYQQCMVVQQLIDQTGLEVELHACPTMRASGGLAMSSRNARLTEAERQRAVAIHNTLTYIHEHLSKGSLQELKKHATTLLEKEEFKVDYVELADADTLEIVHTWNGKTALVALVAAFLGQVRLIDNMKVSG